MKKIFENVTLRGFLVTLSNLVIVLGFCLWLFLNIKFFNGHKYYYYWSIGTFIFMLLTTFLSNKVHDFMKEDEYYGYGFPQFIGLMGLEGVLLWFKRINTMFIHNSNFTLLENVYGWTMVVLVIITLTFFYRSVFSSR